MLNYIWSGLIILGLVAALYFDLNDQLTPELQNDRPIEMIVYHGENNSLAKISKENLSKHFNSEFKNDVYFNAKDFNVKNNKVKNIELEINNDNKLLKKIAKNSGNENTINFKIQGFQILSKDTTKYFMLFEKVNFIKIKSVTKSLLNYAQVAVEISIGLIGIMALWLGLMKIAEDSGLVKLIAKIVAPITKRLFPDIPHNHPAIASIIMNISANMLGLGNAATPFGIKAMEDLNTINEKKDTASNSMCTFLAINTAGLTLIPATAIAVRVAAGSLNPTIIIGTSIFGAFCATIAGVFSSKILEKFTDSDLTLKQKLKASQKNIFLLLGTLLFIVITFLFGFSSNLNSNIFVFLKILINTISLIAIPTIIFFFIIFGLVKKIKIYESFVEGAKEGFNVAVKIIPFLVAMLFAIAVFRAGGAMEIFVSILKPITDFIGMPSEALPMALMRPLSGSGSLGIMTEIIKQHGPDSFVGVLTSTFFGSTETTFYVLAVYFGAVNIKKIRHSLAAGLIADITGILAALFIVKQILT